MAIDIETEASAPKQASNQNGTVINHSLRELIEADRYLTSKNSLSGASASSNPFLLGCAKGVGPGGRN